MLRQRKEVGRQVGAASPRLPRAVLRGAGAAVAGLAITALLAPAAPADTTAALYARVSQGFTATAPGAPTGWTFDGALKAMPPGVASPRQRRVDMVFPRGTSLDVGAVRPCRASDLAILADGPGACPRRSRVGIGDGDVMLGPGAPTRVVVRIYAAPRSLILVTTARESVLDVTRAAVRGGRISFVPRLARLAGGIDPSIVRLTLHVARAGSPRRPLIRTPLACPRGGRWTFAYLPRYDEPIGLQRSTSSTPCAAA